ncbi:MAG: hypothetical protein PWQ91_962 [Eubacteriales bacterium]|nr:hypothetical protein [Eubacteriales bacterium]
MFTCKYAFWESLRRPGKTLFVALVVALSMLGWLFINAYAKALFSAHEKVMRPLKDARIDFLVTSPRTDAGKNLPAGGNEVTFVEEKGQITPGQRFTKDEINLNSLRIFSSREMAEIAEYPSISQLVPALIVQVTRTEGRYPEKIVVEEETVAPLSPEEKKAIDAKLQSNPEYQALSGKYAELQGRVAANSASEEEKKQLQETLRKMQQIEYSYYPERFKKFKAKEIKPPPVKASQTRFVVAGIDATNPDFGLLSKAEIATGSYFSANNAAEVILRKDFAEEKEIKIGDVFSLRDKQLKVIGFAKPTTGLSSAEVYLPLGTLREVVKNEGANVLLVRLKGVERAAKFKETLAKILPDSQVVEPQEMSSQISGALGKTEVLIKEYASFLVAVIVLASIVIVTISLVLTLTARRNEIGVLKVIGWSHFGICRQVAAELVIQTLFGILLSLAVALVLLVVVNNLDLKLNIDFNSVEKNIFGSQYKTFELFHPQFDWVAFLKGSLAALCLAVTVAFLTVSVFNWKTPFKKMEQRGE